MLNRKDIIDIGTVRMLDFKKEINFIYTVDDAFLPLVGVSISSIIQNIKNKEITFFIATEKDDNTNNYLKLVNFYSEYKNVSFKFVDAKKYDYAFEKKNMNKWGSSSYYIYWRLVVPELINVDYAIYLDADILCLKDFDYIDVGDKACGCVIDSVHSIYNKAMGVDTDFCFYNTGTIFIDINKWKQEKLTEKCIDYINNTRSSFPMADQDLFSLALEKYIQIIGPSYNWFAGYDYYGIDGSYSIYGLKDKKFYSKDELLNAKENIIFYHCLDGVFKRPWSFNNDHPAKSQFEYYGSISPWPNYKKKQELSFVMSLEKKLESILPKEMYYRFHNFAIKTYLKKQVSNTVTNS